MKRLTAGFLFASGSVVSVAQSPTSPAASAGWVTLFDGTSTEAWRGYGSADFPETGWVVRDGALVHEARGGGGDVITRRQFANFELELQWRIGPKANSGILYRVVESKQPPYFSGPEYQLLDDAAHEASPDTSAAALYALAAPVGKTLKPAGAWNDARIVVRGDHLEHWLNGKMVVEVDFASESYKAALAKSKFAKWPEFNMHRRGHISLQDHGDEVAFRNIRVRELPPEQARLGEEVVLFDGSGLDAFACFLKDGAEMGDVWSVVDGELVCSGKPTGYLYTKDTFDNFVLQLQWRFDPKKGAGNSGVLLRMSGEHKVWPRSIEAQLESGNAGDFWNIGKFGMNTEAARRNGRNTKKTHAAEKPLGEWNRYEIVVDGSWVQLRVNGEVVNEAWDCEVLPGHIGLQSEGAEIHFRDIRVRPLR
ncbi:MAG: DUF1080 domain-containing protein [Planctomycetota bacterium]